VGDTLTAVKHSAGGLAISEERKHGLITQVELGHVELIKHKGDKFFSNLGVVVWWLSNDNFVLFKGALHDIVHEMEENLLHFLYVLNSARLNRALDSQELLLEEDFVSNVPLLLVHTDEGSLALWLS